MPVYKWHTYDISRYVHIVIYIWSKALPIPTTVPNTGIRSTNLTLCSVYLLHFVKIQIVQKCHKFHKVLFPDSGTMALG